MFSSGSDKSPSPRQDGRALPFNRELSAVASGLGDETETVGSVAPSPMRNASPSSIQGIGLVGDERGDSLRGDSGDYEEEEEEATPLGPETPSASSLRRSELVGSGFNALEPPKSIPDIDARRSKARTNFSRVRTGSPSANDEGGTQTGLSVPLSEVRPPEGRGERDEKVAEGDDHRPGAASSSRPSMERRRRRVDEAAEAKSSSRGKRRHVPTSKRRSEDSEFPWGFTPADQADALVLEGEEYEESEALYPSGGGSQLASDIVSSIGSGGGMRESRAGSVEFAYKAAENDLPRLTTSNSSRNPSPVVDLLSDFDSKSTWAGASAPSVSTTRTGGWGSALETSSALSQFPGSQLSSASRFDEAVWWQHLDQPSRNGDSGIAVVYHGSNSTSSSSRRGGGRTSPQPWHTRGPGGTPAHRGAQKSNIDSNFMSTGSSGRPRGGPQGPSPGSRMVAMSPHGVAMDAAMRIVEERGVRLGILQEEGDAADKAARNLAYDSQIAAPAMTSLEQRRQRAKAWAKSSACGKKGTLRPFVGRWNYLMMQHLVLSMGFT